MKKVIYNKFSFFILSAVFLILSTTCIHALTDKPIVTVLDFTVSQVSEKDAEILVDYFSGHLVSSGNFRVIDRTQRQIILNELKFSYDGCTDEDCQLEIGKLLAARYIFIGSLGKLGSRYILNMSLVEVETGEAIKSVSDKFSSLDELVDDTGRIITIFTEEKRPEEAAAQEPPPSPPSAETKAVPQPPVKLLPMFLNLGVLVGGPMEYSQIDSICIGAYAGGLFPIFKTFYLGASMSVLFSIEDFDSGTVFLGAGACIGDPSDIALGLGIEVAPAVQFTGSVILGGTLIAYIGGFDIRIFYGEDFETGPVLTIGAGGYF